MTLYMFVPDQEQDGTPTCYDDCAEAWPALEGGSGALAGEGADESLLASSSVGPLGSSCDDPAPVVL